MFRLLCILVACCCFSFGAEQKNSCFIYDVTGRVLGSRQLSNPPASVEPRIFGASAIQGIDGRPRQIAAGVYFVSPAGKGTLTKPFSTLGLFSDVSAEVLPDTLVNPTKILVADLNGDGREDIIFAVSPNPCDTTRDQRPRVWIQSPSGIFVDETQARIPDTHASSYELLLFDADGDGSPDIFIGGSGCADQSSFAHLLMNDGTGHFTDEGDSRLPHTPGEQFVSHAAAGKLDHNASEDLAVVVWPYGDFQSVLAYPHLWLNRGDGTFWEDTVHRFPDSLKYAFTAGVYACDLNRDSLTDLLFANWFMYLTGPGGPTPTDSLSGQTAYLKNAGDGFFLDSSQAYIPGGYYRSTRSLGLRDNGNGVIDLLENGIYPPFAPANSPQLRLLKNDGSGHLALVANTHLDSVTGWFNDASFADFDLDGRQDLFLPNVLPGTPDLDKLFLSAGNDQFADRSDLLPQKIDFSVSCALFDYQADHDPDIVLANTGGHGDSLGRNALYENLTNGAAGVPPPKTLPGAVTLFQNYPNPFNPSTVISFGVAHESHVTLKIFNLLGGEAAVLLDNERRFPGKYQVQWNPHGLPSGIYFYQLGIDGRVVDRKKALLLR
jgi:hypothetical protein